MTTLGGPSEVVRRGLVRLDADAVMEVVATLDLRPSTKISPAVGMPLRGLQQRRDVASFAVGAPIAAVRALLELMVAANLDRIVELLGEHSEHPTYDQLARAVDVMSADGVADGDLAALLAFAIGEQFPAAPHCRRIIEERPSYALPEVEMPTAASALRAPTDGAPAGRHARRRRRESAKSKKKAPTSPPRPIRKVRADTPGPASRERVTAPVAASGRRRAKLTPAEARLVDPDHPRSGTIAMVEVPFSARDPETPEIRAKDRPALVVAASASVWLVRGIYSNPNTDRQLFSPWRRLGLDHVSYISDERQMIVAPAGPVVEVARLTDTEWNSLW